MRNFILIIGIMFVTVVPLHPTTRHVCDVNSIGITMKDSVILISPHSDSATLSGLNSTGTDTAYHVIYCSFGDSSSHTALIKGFTIVNGNSNDTLIDNYGGGVFCAHSSPVIDSCVIKNNSAMYGGGGGLCISDSVIIAENTIINNSANEGGGLSISDGIAYNYLDSEILKITHSHLYYNTF